MIEDGKQLIRMKLGGSLTEESGERIDAVTFLGGAESAPDLLAEIAEHLKKVGEQLPKQDGSIWAIYAETEIEKGSLIGYVHCERGGERFICEAVSDKCPRALYEGLPLIVYCEHFSWDAFPANAGSDRSDAALKECVQNYINTESHEFQIQKRFKDHYYVLLLKNGQYVPIRKSAIGSQDHEMRDFRSWMQSVRS